MRKFRRSSRSSRPRLVALVAALGVALLWAQSEMRPRRGAPGGSRGAAPGMAVAATAHAAAPDDQATPEGWGADPFDPRPFGTTPVTTGR